MAKIKRSEVLTYIDTAPSAETYELVGAGVVEASIAMNPVVSEEHFVHLDSASKAVESYGPSMSVTATATEGDAVFEFLDALRKSQAILAAAETTIVNVWDYESGGPSAAPAEQVTVAIAIDSFGGPGGEATKIEYTIHYIGAVTTGVFDTGTKTFT